MADIENQTVAENVEEQIEKQGVASYKVKDGEVFVFTAQILEKLLESAKLKGRVIVFVKSAQEVV